jgi:hypothetical protein
VRIRSGRFLRRGGGTTCRARQYIRTRVVSDMSTPSCRARHRRRQGVRYGVDTVRTQGFSFCGFEGFGLPTPAYDGVFFKKLLLLLLLCFVLFVLLAFWMQGQGEEEEVVVANSCSYSYRCPQRKFGEAICWFLFRFEVRPREPGRAFTATVARDDSRSRSSRTQPPRRRPDR